ncbi:MAG TPA: stage II sporulation protein M [Anaerolineae bacterium]|nr:stage II sporulation protein M [Anaerolineae bacterium]
MAAITTSYTGVGWFSGMSLIVRRELRDTFRDWRMITPIVLLTLFFPVLMTWTAGVAQNFVARFGTPLIAERLIPFLMLIVGFFPMSFSLVIALEAFVGERERKSLEPLLSTPLTDGQLYVGKMIASLVPALMAAFLGIGVYLTGLFIFRGWTPDPLLLAQVIALTITEGIVMVAGAVVVSSRSTSVRAANLLASFIIIPMAILVQVEAVVLFQAIYDAMWGIVLALMVVALILIRMGVELFNREELLGREIDSISIRGIIRRAKEYFVAIAPNQPRAHFNPIGLYRYHVPAALRRSREAILAVILALSVALVGAWVWGSQFSLPPGMLDFSHLNAQSFDNAAANFLLPSFTWSAVWWNNTRAVLLYFVTSIFSFGAIPIALLVLPIAPMAFIGALVGNSGFNPVVFLAAFILPHGIFELPAVIIGAGAAVRVGASLINRDHTMTLGEGWWSAIVDFFKLLIFVVIPLLLIAAIFEVLVTPRIVCAVYGCGG